MTAAKIAEKLGHKAALTEIVEKIHAEIEKKKKKAARRGALGYWGHLGLWVEEGVWDVWAQHKWGVGSLYMYLFYNFFV